VRGGSIPALCGIILNVMYLTVMGEITLKVFVTFLTFVVGVTVATLWSIYHSPPSQMLTGVSSNFTASEESEEYAVYSALIMNEFVKDKDDVKLLVISDRTQFYANPDYLKSTGSEERIRDMKKYHPTVAEDTLRDYEAKHVQPSRLDANFNLPVKYILFDEASLEKDEEGARMFAFYEKYQDAGGMISLSKVGFNKDRTEALVRVKLIFCPLCSLGGKVLLRKERGAWRVVENFG
jgi:hypothetical protein